VGNVVTINCPDISSNGSTTAEGITAYIGAVLELDPISSSITTTNAASALEGTNDFFLE